ncbi:MAG TPA: PucR family transcriptional regulator ligand-binding domain-containing protein [Solirubrobacteraceae bacterium]|jgi:purine catabolism regulator|nr:PucR family transcriptional regulator ligand-binding domain-containing protein [Solirubrobacteraceae bacterium]
MLTVRGLIEDLDFRVLTGESNLDMPVRWVHLSEWADPTPWLSGGEVLLTAGMQLDSPAIQRDYIRRLAEHQLAGLGFGTGLAHDAVPPDLLRTAEELEFPVFEVPYEVPFIAITEAAFTQLVNEQYAVLRRAIAAQERLERIVLSQRGLEALAGALATLVGAAVLVFDGRGELLAKHAFRRPIDQALLDILQGDLRERARRRDARPFMPGVEDPSRALALPVAADGSPAGHGASATPGKVAEAWLVAIKDAEPLSDFDRLTLRQAVTIVALELLRERVAGDTERRLAGDVLAAMVSGELTGAELGRRLEPFGLADEVAAVVMSPPSPGPRAAAAAEAALAGSLRAEACPALVAASGRLVCALIPGGREDDLVALAERVAERVETELAAPVHVGLGRPVSGADTRRSYHEARCTLEAMALGFDRRGTQNGRAGAANGNGHAGPAVLKASRTASRVATYKDLGSFQLLLSLQDDEALKLFCDSILGPIEQSEGHYGGELMRSLEAFIEENGQWEKAARRLYCHRHTLRYRIRRVEELTGRDLASARDRIEFWLALRGRELVA